MRYGQGSRSTPRDMGGRSAQVYRIIAHTSEMAHPRGKMPHNNRVSSSVSLQTNDIWTKTIGHNPYSTGDDIIDKEQSDRTAGLLLLAKMSNLSGSETRGACSKCGMVGHLTFQCRNPSKSNISDSESDVSSSDEEVLEAVSDHKLNVSV
jgi:hypothetical protein